ncbi:MAG: TSUP family transporter [Actinomycetota bacterium]
MDLVDSLLLFVVGAVAATINTLAGGGSLITVPTLVLVGAPGTVANGTNRIGILAGTVNAARTFSKLGVQGMRGVGRVLAPAVVGSVIGSVIVSRIADDTFEQIFGVLMIPILLLSLRKPNTEALAEKPQWPVPVTTAVFFAIGMYGGAFQVGVGLMILVALARAGVDLVIANHIKVITTALFTFFALPAFIINDRVDWELAIPLALGFGLGGWVGAKLNVAAGARIVRPVMIVAVIALSGRLLGLY